MQIFRTFFSQPASAEAKEAPQPGLGRKKPLRGTVHARLEGVNQNKIYIMNQQRHTNEDTLTDIFGSEEMRSPAPTEFIPKGKTAAEIAYQLVKD